METLAQSFLTIEEQQKITTCVQEMEKKTSGEIVPMIVSASHSYPLAAVIGGVFFAIPAALLSARIIGSALWIGPDNMWLFLACLTLLFGIAHQCIKRSLRLKKYFLLAGRSDTEVREAATAAFFNEKLYLTKAANGILLYISVFERRVWVLADAGINEKIPQERWQEIVELITDGIRNNRQCEAICEAVTKTGNILQEHFPIESDDKNELHNLIIR